MLSNKNHLPSHDNVYGSEKFTIMSSSIDENGEETFVETNDYPLEFVGVSASSFKLKSVIANGTVGEMKKVKGNSDNHLSNRDSIDKQVEQLMKQ